MKGSNLKLPWRSLVNLMVHVIFSTKNRVPLITPEIEPELFAYVGGILKNHDCRLLDGGGTANHIHLLVSQSKNVGLSTLIKDVKKNSSLWIKTKGNEFRDFYWHSQVDNVQRYIVNQKEHHRTRSLEDEFVKFLIKYELEYDERYLWS